MFTIDEVETAFHEFGHALHGLLTKCHYASVSGTNVARDFVETFSQFNENWAFQPEILALYAKNYKTGEVIPDSLVAKINNSHKFNQGFMTSELCAASILDMNGMSSARMSFQSFVKAIRVRTWRISRLRFAKTWG
jgi:peptidyl-dipeptidase Dcp